jgi:nucleotide-binding universal stress UspA family protein
MKPIKRIVVPVDLAEHSETLVHYAVHIAEQFSANLSIIHVIAPFPADTMIGAPLALECQEKAFAAAKEHMANLVKGLQAKMAVETEIVHGDPVDKITSFAKEKGADLIITSTHGAKGLEKILLGSVAERVLKRAHCPVLVVNPFKQQL